LCIGKRVSGQTGHLFWDRGSIIFYLHFFGNDSVLHSAPIEGWIRDNYSADEFG
jgi:hypothetical protein